MVRLHYISNSIMPNKKFSLWKKSSSQSFLQPLSNRRFSVLKIFQLCVYFQILTICGVRAVFIFPLRLSPEYYIPGLVDPPPSKPYSINNALKFSHSSKSAQDITNEFLRRFSQVPRKSKPTKPSKPSKPNKPGKSPPSPYSSVTQKAGIDFALPLNYEISNPSGQKPGQRLETIDEKLVLIVFKLPVRKFQEKPAKKQFSSKIRIKRQRPSLQFYERQDAEAAEGAPSRTLSLGKKIRSWWEGGARPTSAYPKFRPTRPNRPFSGRPFTTTSSKFFFGKFLKNGSTQRPRPSRSPPTRGKSSPSTTKSPFMTFSDYTFNSPGCHPRGPKLILCSTDRIEHLSMLLEKFMHYQERNNLSPYFIDTDEEDSDSYGSYDNYPPSYRHNFGYRPSGKVVGRSRKPFGGVVESDTPGHHPSVVVLAMNNKDNEENHEEEEQHSSSHSHEGYHQQNKDHEEPKEGSEETKDTVEIVPKGEMDESTKSPRKKRNKRKLVRRVQRRSKEEISSSSEESLGGGSHREHALSDRYLSTKREIEDERDAEYKRLKRLLKLIKRYQELI